MLAALPLVRSLNFKTVQLEQDEEYAAAGASLGSAAEAFGQDIVLKVRVPGELVPSFFPGGAGLLEHCRNWAVAHLQASAAPAYCFCPPHRMQPPCCQQELGRCPAGGPVAG